MRQAPVFFSQIVCLLFMAPSNAQVLHEAIEEAVQAELKRSGAPSLQVAIGRKGEVVFEGAFGLADVENNVPATALTKYRTSSISKWLTATAAVMLSEQGRLDLDEPVQQYCSDFPKKTWPITSRQLLVHKSGIRHYADYESELSQADSAKARADIERKQTLDALATYTRYTDVLAPLNHFKDDPLVFEPGTSWLYSSFGYRLLGCVLEGASGQTYRSLLADTIMGPVGMTSTVPDDAWTIIPNRAAGYRLDRGKPLRRADMRDVSENLPAGGHLSTATDLVAFVQAFHARELVSAESVSLMTQGLSSNPGDADNYTSWRHAVPSPDKYAYGIMSFPNERGLWMGHTGRQAGSSSIVVLVPDQDLVIAVLTNVKGWGGYLSLVRELYSIVERDVAVVVAEDMEFDAEQFVVDYLAARTATQQPTATIKDIEHYLSFLVEDVGYQHLPYNSDDSRYPDGKSGMREGMTFYLGKNKKFTAELVNFTQGFDVVAIQYKGVHEYQREGEPLTVDTYSALDVLELENGKVTVIREYLE